jgi:mono/diheme cytochrome c family protein
MTRRALLLLLSALAAALAGCTRSNMDSQPKYHEYERAGLFRNGRVLQSRVPGTVARGDAARADAAKQKPAVTTQLLARGRDQYDVFCAPCHDRVGTGNGIVVQRGLPKPQSLHSDAMRAADDQHFYDVISDGFGVMYAHGDRVPPRDRWAIVAYIRALQLSRHSSFADLPADQQSRLNAEKTP